MRPTSRVEATVKNLKNVIALLVLVLLFSCKKAGSFATAERDVASPSVASADAQNAGVQLVGRATPAASVEDTAPKVPRMIVRTAEMRIVVADTTKAVDAVTKSVEAMGGFVSGSNI